MKTHIISGSHRSVSQSARVSQYLQAQIIKKGGEASITELANGTLPLWNEEVWAATPEWKKIWDPIATQLKSADSLIFVVPEYAGMAGPAIKNFILFCGGDLIAHKPTMIVSVTSSLTNGAYPIMELRGSSYKNAKQIYIPDHVIVRDAEKALLGDVPTNSNDEYLRKRIDYSLSMLGEYEKALKLMRENFTGLSHKDYPFGM